MLYAVIVALFIGFVSTPVSGLTMDEAIATGLRNNPEIQAFRLEEEAARGQVATAKLPPFSNPLVEGSLSRKNRESGEPGGAFRNSQISLSQTIEIAGQRGLRIDAAVSSLERSRFEIRDLERTLKADIGNAFTQSLFLRDKLALTKEYQQLQEDLTGLVSAKFLAGDVAALEVNLSQVELARAQRDVIASSREYANSLVSLKRLMGMSSGSTVSIEGELGVSLPSLPPRDKLLSRIVERPDVKAAEAEIRRSEAAERVVRREAIPSVTWSIFTGRSEGSKETGGTLGISIPLFDRKQGEHMEAKARVSQAHIRQNGIARTAAKDIEEAYGATSSALDELDLFKQSILGRTIENLALLQLAFKEGKISFYDVRVAQRETIETRSAYLEALLTTRRAYNALERAIGGEL
jgi:outer membrane protein, heavy metal efflux system